MPHVWTIVPAQPRVALSQLKEPSGRNRPRQVKSVARWASMLNRAGWRRHDYWPWRPTTQQLLSTTTMWHRPPPERWLTVPRRGRFPTWTVLTRRGSVATTTPLPTVFNAPHTHRQPQWRRRPQLPTLRPHCIRTRSCEARGSGPSVTLTTRSPTLSWGSSASISQPTVADPSATVFVAYNTQSSSRKRHSPSGRPRVPPYGIQFVHLPDPALSSSSSRQRL